MYTYVDTHGICGVLAHRRADGVDDHVRAAGVTRGGELWRDGHLEQVWDAELQAHLRCGSRTPRAS